MVREHVVGRRLVGQHLVGQQLVGQHLVRLLVGLGFLELTP
jgi:hypothetical protein